jgi:hypothetical protein
VTSGSVAAPSHVCSCGNWRGVLSLPPPTGSYSMLVWKQRFPSLCSPCAGAMMEVNREKSEAIAVHQEVPDEEAAVDTIGTREDRYGDRHLATGRRQQPKKWTQGDGGFRQKLGAARGRFTRRAVVVRDQASTMYKGPQKADVCEGMSDEAVEKQWRKGPKPEAAAMTGMQGKC